MTVLLFVVLVVEIIIAVCVILIVFQGAAIRKQLSRIQKSLASLRSGGSQMRHPHIFQQGELGYFTIWEWRRGSWKLKSGDVPRGFDPGPPPSHPGTFEGDHVRKWVTKA